MDYCFHLREVNLPYNFCKSPTSRRHNDKCDHLAISSLCSKHHKLYYLAQCIYQELLQLSRGRALLDIFLSFALDQDRYLSFESVGLLLPLRILNFPTFFLLRDYFRNCKFESVLAKYQMEILIHTFDNVAIVKDSRKFHASLKQIF